jgi:hypothetical protein
MVEHPDDFERQSSKRIAGRLTIMQVMEDGRPDRL